MSTELEARSDRILAASDAVRLLEYRVESEAEAVANLAADGDTTSDLFHYTVGTYRKSRDALSAGKAEYTSELNANQP